MGVANKIMTLRVGGALGHVKHPRSGDRGTVPNIQRPSYLDSDMLIREREMLRKRLFVLDRRRRAVKRAFDEISEQVESSEKEEARRQEVEAVSNL